MRDNLEEEMAKTKEKCDSLLNIREIELPVYDEKIKYMHGRVSQVNHMLLDKYFEDKNMVTKRLVFSSFLENLKERRREKKMFGTMVKHLENFQRYHAFRRYERQVDWEAKIKDKSKIDGAYLLLKRFKNRLKNYDSALEKVD